MGQIMAGIPETSTLMTVNRQCSSGLTTCAIIANAIRSGQIEVGVAGGVESMSTGDMSAAVNPETLWAPIFDHEVARNCMLPMGLTSENVAEQFGVTREAQDTLAVSSHDKSLAA
jgi:acetyl-CoA acyltransferase 1